MFSPLPLQHAQVLVHERQLRAAADNRARRLLTVRRWQKRAEVANHQVRLARLAVG